MRSAFGSNADDMTRSLFTYPFRFDLQRFAGLSDFVRFLNADKTAITEPIVFESTRDQVPRKYGFIFTFLEMSALVKSILNAGKYGPASHLYDTTSGSGPLISRLLFISGIPDTVEKSVKLSSANAVWAGDGTFNINFVLGWSPIIWVNFFKSF